MNYLKNIVIGLVALLVGIFVLKIVFGVVSFLFKVGIIVAVLGIAYYVGKRIIERRRR